MLKYFYVFHASQITGIKPYELEGVKDKEEVKPNAIVEKILMNCGAKVKHGGYEAFYSPLEDTIHVPCINNFVDSEVYYSTLLHELSHWTGNTSRLNMGNQNYPLT